MSEETLDQNASDADPRIEVLQAVVDRVTSWQEGATAETIRTELEDALSESEVDADDATRERIVARLVADGQHFDVSEVLS